MAARIRNSCLAIIFEILVFVSYSSSAVISNTHEWELFMPDVTVKRGETYLCYGKPVDTNENHYIVEFEPKATMDTVHHIIIYGCKTPGSMNPLWNCGEMASTTGLEVHSPCGQGAQIIYAWGRNADTLKLPEGVGFKVGGNSDIDYLVLQVHYAIPVAQPDRSGILLTVTENNMPRQAGVFLLGTAGSIGAGDTEHFESACAYQGSADLHPFAYRTHTHGLGKVVSGYVVRDGEWINIGKKSPLLPQMFYPVKDESIIVHPGDTLAARCTMTNTRDHTVRIGSTNEDEMCNFYMMFWVDGDRIPDRRQCFTSGPPYWYWKNYQSRDNMLLNNPPADVSVGVPGEDDLALKHHHG